MIESIGAYAPFPRNQYNPAFMEKHGVILLKEDDHEVIAGLVEDSSDLRGVLKKYHRGKRCRFLPVDRKDHSVWLARLVSDQSFGSESEVVGQDGLTLDRLAGDAPIINLVNSIIMDGIRRGASDIHIEKYGEAMRIRYRIDGVLRVARSLKGALFPYVSSRVKIMAQLNIMETRLPQDGRISVAVGNEKVDLRVSVIPVIGEGESIVLRILNRTIEPLKLEELGFNRDHVSEINGFISLSNGLVLITGPTGSGKSTTLNSILRRKHSREIKIISIEDPVEYIVEGVEQIQTNEKIGLTFSSLLKRVLRHDPNVIMVGEIRDRETAELAVRSAMTGHLVFSTLHTNDALSSVTRLLNMGIDPFLLSSVLRGVTAQRLVRTICPVCKEAYPVGGREEKLYSENYLGTPNSLYRGKGCPECEGTGYRGRTIINEMIPIDEDWEDLIGRNCPPGELKNLAERRGLTVLLQDGLAKAAEGITTLEEVEKAVNC